MREDIKVKISSLTFIFPYKYIYENAKIMT